MNATLSHSNQSHGFYVEHEGRTFRATILTNAKGKFAGEEITSDDGAEVSDEIADAIVKYLSENWDKLVSK